jgi:hypothetical protein
MMNIKNIKNTLSLATGRTGLILKKHSPEILIAAGVVGIVASTIMACKATLKADTVINDTKEKLDRIHYAKENVDSKEYSDTDYKKDLSITYFQAGLGFIKLYGPAVLLSVASIGCILGSHGIMKKRNLALVAAYKAVEESFNKYRKRVVDELGEEKDKMFKTGVHQEKVSVVETDENGNKVKVKKTIETIDPNSISQYARFFDEASAAWSKTPEYNMTFLRCQQNYANDLLHSRGHLFLNEVYDMLKIPRSQAGAVVGWVRGEGDDFVDFGIFDGERMAVRDFVNGYERSILLDFNVSGLSMI